MKLTDRLVASLEYSRGTLEGIDRDIEVLEEKIASLRERRLREEEAALETQLLLNLVRDTGLKVERREEDGMLVASVDEKYGRQEEAIQ
jgi:hypothetical protein